jgi:DNA-binding GntR family transcriptional regulator
MDAPVVVRTIREQIVDHLRGEVLAGKYKEGTPLREQHLAQKYRVSRGPIRDALLQLTKEGLLLALPNRGVKVKRRPSERSRQLLVSIRRQIETYALRDVFPRLTAEHHAKWEQNLRDFEAACQKADMAAVVQYDMAFHRSLVETADHDDLVAVWVPIMTHMMLPYSRHKNLMESYQEHLAIYHAIQRGDLEDAVRKLEANIQ